MLSDFLVGTMIGWLLCLAIVLVLYGIVKRRADRLENASRTLHQVATSAVHRHALARQNGHNDEWIILARTMDRLDKVAQEWETLVDGPQD